MMKKLSFLSRPVSVKECGDTGMAMVLVCLLVGIHLGSRQWLFAAVALLLINMIFASVYKPVAKCWLGLSHLMGTVASTIILSVVFFLIVTPLSLLRRGLKHDPMRLKAWKNGRTSVFVTRDHTYTAQELEQPF